MEMAIIIIIMLFRYMIKPNNPNLHTPQFQYNLKRNKMKQVTILLLSMVIGLASCQKQGTVFTPSANLLVANVIVGGSTLTFNGLSSTVSNNNSQQYPLYVGQDSIHLYNAATSPITNYYNQPLTAANVDNYSLFLAGASPTAVDAILIKETYSNYNDSSC